MLQVTRCFNIFIEKELEKVTSAWHEADIARHTDVEKTQPVPEKAPLTGQHCNLHHTLCDRRLDTAENRRLKECGFEENHAYGCARGVHGPN